MVELSSLRRLDVGCGSNKSAGFLGMDARALPGVDVVHDLEVLPWPFPDNSFSLILMSHVWEHIKPWLTIQIMDEMWRVLGPGGQLQIVVPYGWSHGFVMDPTHCNPSNEDTWRYFDPKTELYKIYSPKPWRILRVESQLAGNMFAAMEPLSKEGAILNAFELPPKGDRVWTDAEVAAEFHQRWYNTRTPKGVTDYAGIYNGRVLDKTPLDLWRYIELIERVKPEVIIEAGTANGASAQFFADQMERSVFFDEKVGDYPKVVSIDVDDGLVPFEGNSSRTNPGARPTDTRISYLLGSSIDKEIALEAMRQSEGKRTMVVLDSDHTCNHVVVEMLIYWPLVTSGSYMVVEDANVNGHPVYEKYGAGPYEAVQRWLPDHAHDAEIDTELASRFMGVTANVWIRKK